MLNQMSQTAIKAVIYLASQQDGNDNAGIREIAGYIDASEHTVGKVLQTLARAGIINSVKGPSGGFHISREQLKRPIIHIVDAIEGKELFTQCGLGLKKCSASRPCPIHDEYKAARELVHKIFASKKISDLCNPVNNGLAYLI